MFFITVNLIVIVVFLALVGRQGIWNNVIALVNTLFAALLATNSYERLANFLDANMPEFTYLWDFISLWALFALFAGLFQLLTNFLSGVKMRFKKPFDIAGGYLLSIWTAWIFICFATMTLHTAPLPRTALFGSFQATPESSVFLGMAPDRQWLALMHNYSQTTFSKSVPYVYETDEQTDMVAETGRYIFDRDGEFIIKYGARRWNLEEERDPGVFAIRVRRDVEATEAPEEPAS